MSEEIATEKDGNDLEATMITVNQNKFNPIIVPSLQDICMSCIVTTIYKQQHVLEIIQQPGDEEEKLSDIEQHLHQKLIQLPMPCSLMDKALSFCKFIAFQGNYMLGLTRSLTDGYGICGCGFDFSIPVEYFDCMCFKVDCTVDKLKTFTLLSETDYPDYKIFIVASHLCSQELANKSWRKISPHYLQGSCELLYNVLRYFQDDKYGLHKCRINIYWLYFVNDKLSELCDGMFEGSYAYSGNSLNVNMFLDALRHDNSEACKYFFQLMIDDEKEYIMDRWMKEALIMTIMNFNLTVKSHLECYDIYFFLLSETNDSKKLIEELRNRIEYLIPAFVLNVAYEKFLEPVMQFIWNLLDKEDFCYIFETILGMVRDGNHKATKLFKELWCLCSKSGRKQCSEDFVRSLDLSKSIESSKCHLFENDFFEMVKLILSDGPDDGKGRCLYSLVNDSKLCSSIIADISYLNAIDNFLCQLILSSEKEVDIFKKCAIDSCNFDLILHWIKLDDYDSVNKFFKWSLTSEGEIDVYKRNSIEISTLLYYILVDYEKANKFLNWCSNSESEIKEFKKNFLLSIDITFGDFDEYREYVEWCFESEQDLKGYKKYKSKFKNLCDEVTGSIVCNDFGYANKMIDWCLGQEKVKRFKLKVFDSKDNMVMLERIVESSLFAENYKREYPSIREMAKKLSLWYGPVGLRRIRQMKKSLRGKKREMEEMDDSVEKQQECFLNLLEELVKSLEADHKST